MLFIGIIYLFYLGFLWLMLLGWKRVETHKTNLKHAGVPISVIVPFKNEANNLNELCGQLKAQTLNPSQFEVFFVDDHSSDLSADIVKDFCSQHPNFNLLTNRGSGKKEALNTALDKTTYNLIITLDADIEIAENHLIAFSCFAARRKCDLIIGPVSLQSSNFSLWNKFQSVEFQSLITSTAGSAGFNHAIMCNGANLLFNKQLLKKPYLDVVKHDIPSGDDMFLLEYARKNKWNIGFLKNSDAIARIKPQNFRNFLKQRKRWSSKALRYRQPDILVVGMLILFTNIALLINFVQAFNSTSWAVLFATFMTFKYTIEYALLKSSSQFFNTRSGLGEVWLFSLLYPFYIALITSVSLFIKSDWRK